MFNVNVLNSFHIIRKRALRQLVVLKSRKHDSPLSIHFHGTFGQHDPILYKEGHALKQPGPDATALGPTPIFADHDFETVDAIMNRMREVQQMLNLVSQEDLPLLPQNCRDAVFVCIDLEAFEFAHDRITEIGVCVLDTRDLAGVPTASWLTKIHYAFYRPVEHARFVNKRHIKGCPEDFNFGPSTWIALRDANQLLTRIFLDPTQLSHAADFAHEISPPSPKRNVIFVAHGASNDVTFMRSLQFDVATDGKVVKTVDTQATAGGSKKQSIGLQRLLCALGWDPENSHNAGNDAAYTLQALVTMAVADHERPGWVGQQLARWQGKLPAARYVKRHSPKVWGGTATPASLQKQEASKTRAHVSGAAHAQPEERRARKEAFRKDHLPHDGHEPGSDRPRSIQQKMADEIKEVLTPNK